MNHTLRSASTIIMLAVATCSGAYAQTDTSTALMAARSQFSIHDNYCDSSTETFVTVLAANSTARCGAQECTEPYAKGFCLERTRRTAATWVNARQTCVAAGKRLPEIGEYQLACLNAGSLSPSASSLPGSGYEWAGNTPLLHIFGDSSSYGAAVNGVGDGDCYNATIGQIGNHVSGKATFAFRCVR